MMDFDCQLGHWSIGASSFWNIYNSYATIEWKNSLIFPSVLIFQ